MAWKTTPTKASLPMKTTWAAPTTSRSSTTSAAVVRPCGAIVLEIPVCIRVWACCYWISAVRSVSVSSDVWRSCEDLACVLQCTVWMWTGRITWLPRCMLFYVETKVPTQTSSTHATLRKSLSQTTVRPLHCVPGNLLGLFLKIHTAQGISVCSGVCGWT